jgi:hypothetical protein
VKEAAAKFVGRERVPIVESVLSLGIVREGVVTQGELDCQKARLLQKIASLIERVTALKTK